MSRHVIDATGTIPPDCPDPMAAIRAAVDEVWSKAVRIIRDDRRWKVLPDANGIAGPHVQINDDGTAYRVHVVLDTEAGMMPILEGDEQL